MIELTYDVNVPLIMSGHTKVDSIDIEAIKEINITGKVSLEGAAIEGLCVKFSIATYDEQVARGLAEEHLGHMKRILYFKLNKAIKWWDLDSIKNANKNIEYIHFPESFRVKENVKVELTYQHLDDLKESFALKDQYQQSFVDLFINISQIKGYTGKYIMTYSILSALLGNQGKVDDFIKKHEKNVKMQSSTLQNSKKKETIYTYLRNQLGHTEENINVNNLEQEVKGHLSKLSEITKKAILEG